MYYLSFKNEERHLCCLFSQLSRDYKFIYIFDFNFFYVILEHFFEALVYIHYPVVLIENHYPLRRIFEQLLEIRFLKDKLLFGNLALCHITIVNYNGSYACIVEHIFSGCFHPEPGSVLVL